MHPDLRRHLSCCALLGSSVLTATACADTSAGTGIVVARTDSAGIEIVTSSGGEHALDWTFEPLLTIGDEDGDYALGGVSDDAVASGDGLIYVLDGMAHRVLVFDTTGAPVRSFGRKGGGPGEFEFPADVMAAPDGSVGVFAFDKGAIVRFDTLGAPLEERRLPAPPNGNVALLRGDPVYTASPRRAEEDAAPSQLALVIDRGAVIDTVTTVPAPESEYFQLPNCGIGLNIPPLLSPEIVWAVAGDRLFYNNAAELDVRVYADDGLVRIVRRSLPPLPGTLDIAVAEMRDTFRIRGGPYDCRIAAREVAEVQGYAAVAPHVARIVASAEGGFWIRRRSADGTKPIDVFDAGGVYLGTLPHDAPWPSAFMPDGSFLAVEKDEFDVPRIVRYRVAGGPLSES